MKTNIEKMEAQIKEMKEALIKAESALTYANWDGDFSSKYTAADVVNARDLARKVLKSLAVEASDDVVLVN